MMRFLLASALASLSAGLIVPSLPVNYDGYKVFRVNAGRQIEAVQSKLNSIHLGDFWNNRVESHIDVAVSPKQLEAFHKLGLDSYCMHEDLGKSIAGERAAKSVYKRQVDDLAWYDQYHTYEENIAYLDDLQSSFPSQSERFSVGKSYEGRDIEALHIWGEGGPGKPAVIYHGTVHAREWITAPVIEYVTLQLINGYKNGDNTTRAILDSYDFYVLPIVNPDGFVYSRDFNRLWRKNRQPPPGGANQTCFGRDNNRNWGFAWDANPRGASTNPCSQIYRGELPQDTPEIQVLDAFLQRIRDEQTVKLYIDWHSYGQYILYPWGFNETLYPPELGKWTKASSLMSAAIRTNSDVNATFTFGPSGATLYTTTGSSVDHAYEIGGAEWSLTIELRDNGQFGFVLPPDQIRGTAEEQWAGQQVLLSVLDEVYFDGIGPVAGIQGGTI